VDRNGDHRISRTEAGTYKSLIDRFAYLDTDGDGFISESEFAAAHATLKSGT
jgi:Ca2+-binding EF-hand superfamily protein